MISLDKNKMQEGIGVIVKAANTDIIDSVNEIAQAISTDADNDMVEKLKECGNKLQTNYNEMFKPAMDELIANFSATYDIAELIEKASVGDVSNIDTSFSGTKIDPSAVRL